jgi:hypothetical protein
VDSGLGRLWVHIELAALFGNAVPYLLFAVASSTWIPPRA